MLITIFVLFVAILNFTNSVIADRQQQQQQQLEPIAIVRKPIPLIVHRNEDKTGATSMVARRPTPSTDQRQMTVTDNSNEDDEELGNPSNNNDYENGDELPEWIPPPPPPPPASLLPSNTGFGPGLYSSPTEMVSRHRPSPLTHHHRSDEFTLFLVILTIAGFFGLIISMFMPFILLLQSQAGGGYGGIGPVGGIQPAIIPATLGGVPGPTTFGQAGLIGRKRRNVNHHQSFQLMKELHATFFTLKASNISRSHQPDQRS